MVFSPVIEAFSVSHAQILAAGQDFLTALATAALAKEDIYGVNEASLEPDMDSYDNEGDDVILSTWDWLNKADLTVQAGYVSFPLIAELTGQTISSGTIGGKVIMGLDLWHEDSMSPAPKPVIIKMPSKDKAGNRADFVIGLYKVSFKPIQFDGPAYKDGLKINYDGTALFSDTDEKGQPFADGKKRVGRLLSIEK
jgi:hypothetical protein